MGRDFVETVFRLLKADGSYTELAALLIASVLVGLAWPYRNGPLACRLRSLLPWMIRHAVLLTGLLTFGIAWVAVAINDPAPQVSDEFANLLLGDTLAHGRFANPPLAFPDHFFSSGVLQTPTYSSKYPPGLGAFFALGIILLGNPMWGSCLSMSMASAACCWMFQARFQGVWPLIGGLMIAFHRQFPDRWVITYWGGQVGMLGGALVFGATLRLVQKASVMNASVLTVGLFVLAISRAFEGLVVSIPLLFYLGYLSIVNYKLSSRIRWRTLIVIPAILATMGALLILDYQRALTGNAFQNPHILYSSQYLYHPEFLFLEPTQPSSLLPEYIQAENQGYRDQFVFMKTIEGFRRIKLPKLAQIWTFYIGLLLSVPLLIYFIKKPSSWEWLALIQVLLAITCVLLTYGTFTHYVSPAAPALYALILAALTRWSSVYGRPFGFGKKVVTSILLASVLLTSAKIAWGLSRPPRIVGAKLWHRERQALQRKLEADGERHLILVVYENLRSPDWVYNGADLENSKVIWARSLSNASDQGLIDHFPGRKIWKLQAGTDGNSLQPW